MFCLCVSGVRDYYLKHHVYESYSRDDKHASFRISKTMIVWPKFGVHSSSTKMFTILSMPVYKKSSGLIFNVLVILIVEP